MTLIELKKAVMPYTNALTVLSLVFILISIVEVAIGYQWTRVGGVQPVIDSYDHVLDALKFSAIIFSLGMLYGMSKNRNAKRDS